MKCGSMLIILYSLSKRLPCFSTYATSTCRSEIVTLSLICCSHLTRVNRDNKKAYKNIPHGKN